MNYGCAIVSFSMPDREGFVNEITLGFNELKDYFDNRSYFGVIIGRFANRIKSGKFSIGDENYSLAVNDQGKNHLHGGIKGYDKIVWYSEIIQENNFAGIKFTYLSKDGEEGYPGNLEIEVKYILNDRNELIFEYRAKTDKITPVNLCNHSYWNLAGPESGPVYNHELKLNCDNYLPVNNELLPTGEIKPVYGGPFDFIKRKKIGKDLDKIPGGYNHCFIINSLTDINTEKATVVDIKNGDLTVNRLNDHGVSLINDGKSIDFVASVYEPLSGRLMEVYTSKPSLQFYSGNFVDKVKGRYGIMYDKSSGFALETENYPDSVNISKFPSSLLKPDEEYHHITIHKFSTL